MPIINPSFPDLACHLVTTDGLVSGPADGTANMDPQTLGKKYDRIANWWQGHLENSDYGVKQLGRALQFCDGGYALDVGCGCGGRMVRLMQEHGLAVTGIDVSVRMLELACASHPDVEFIQADICTFRAPRRYDFILAWDSIFHLPLSSQEAVVSKLCDLLNPGGILIYTFGDAEGEHEDTWRDDTFYYSSIGITRNLNLLAKHQVACRHLELDQWPEKHVYVIGTKN